MILTDRSRTLAVQSCGRRRFMEYEWGGRGVVPVALAIELVTGSATHVGVGALLEGKGVEEAVVGARAEFDAELAGRSLATEDDSLAYTRLEQLTLVEMLTRMYAARQLPRMLEEFEVQWVEREIVMPLTPELGWMARADALLKRRADGDLYVYSLKTCKEWSERKDEENRLDMQGVSELAAVEHLTGGRVMGVKMEFLVKGKRDRYTKWLQDSALVRPWRKQEQFGVQWQWQGRVPCANPAECKYHRSRPSADPYHNLADGWERVPVWEHMTAREWFEMLAAGEVGVGDPFEGLIATPIPYYRNRDDVARWRRQVIAQETRLAAGAARCNQIIADGGEGLEEACDEHFPQHKRSCVWGKDPDNSSTRCPYYDKDTSACAGTGGTLVDPLGNGLVWRRPHHAPEVNARSLPLVGRTDAPMVDIGAEKCYDGDRSNE